METDSKQHINSTIDKNQDLNNGYLKDEIIRLDKWADDLIGNLDKEIKDEKKRLRNFRKEREQASNNTDYIDFQEKALACEKKISKMRRELDDKEEEIFEKKNENIKKLKDQMKAETKCETLFKIRWKVI